VRTVIERLYDQAASRPDHTAVVYGDERVTWADLVERVERLAAGLRERGVEPGDAVAVLLREDAWFVACVHAITGLGAILVPLNPAFKQAELENAFRSSGVRAIVADERTLPAVEEIGAGLDGPVEAIGPSLEPLAAGSGARLEPRALDEVFLYQFSSGSTGRPKRVARTHAHLAAEADLYEQLGLTPDDVLFGAVPMFHTYGFGALLLSSATSGATLAIMDEPNPFVLRRGHALEMIERERATVFPGVPFNFRLMAEAPGTADLSSLRLCFSAGTALPRPAFDAFLDKFGIPVRQLYGCTEAGIVAANMDEDPVASFESVGVPLGDASVEIVDDEVTISSPALTEGYSDADPRANDAFQDGRFFTGDLGRVDEQGRLYLAGRKKLLIEVGGYKVDPIEVQDVVEAHPVVEEAVVLGVPGRAANEEAVKAVVVANGDCDERELVGFCQERLANYKVPRIVEFRDEIPKSPLGKILRKYLV
jgi:long-chain acyl-CoA synthetase